MENRKQTENRGQTEKVITEATLIVDGFPGWAGQQALNDRAGWLNQI